MSRNSFEPISIVRKKVTLTHDFVSTSYHEAGHVVYGLLHFIMIYSAHVYECNEQVDGKTHYYSPYFENIKNQELLTDRLKAEIGLSYAGLAAQKYHYKLFSGSDKFLSCLDGSKDDMKTISDIIKKYSLTPPGRPRYSFKKKMIRQVDSELQEHWEAVTIVAHALFRKKRLSFHHLKKLLTTKTDNKEFWKEHLKKISHYYENEEKLDETDFLAMMA